MLNEHQHQQKVRAVKSSNGIFGQNKMKNNQKSFRRRNVIWFQRLSVFSLLTWLVSLMCSVHTNKKDPHTAWSYFYFIYQLSVLTDKTDFGKKYLLFYSSSTQLSYLIFHAEAATVKFKYIHNHNLETKSISSSLLVMKLWLLMSWSYFLLEHEAYSLHSTKSILEPREELVLYL